MSKHHKLMNQQQLPPTIKVVSEIQTTEEGKKLLDESLAEMEKYTTSKKSEADSYFDEQHKKADNYYAQKLDEADKLKGKAEEFVQREVDKCVKTKEKEMKDEIDSAKRDRHIGSFERYLAGDECEKLI